MISGNCAVGASVSLAMEVSSSTVGTLSSGMLGAFGATAGTHGCSVLIILSPTFTVAIDSGLKNAVDHVIRKAVMRGIDRYFFKIFSS